MRTIDPGLAATSQAARLQLAELNAGLATVGGVITGSIRFGCNDNDGFPGPFQRRITTPASLDEGGKIATSHVTYFECFEHVSVRFHSDEPKPWPSEEAVEASWANGSSSSSSSDVFTDDHLYRRGRRGADSSAVGFSHSFTRNLVSQGALDVTCSNCYASARIGVDFEIEMTGLTLKKFTIGLSGSVKATVRLVATVTGAVTIFDFDKKIPFSDSLTNALSVAVFGPVSMAIKPQFSLWAAVSAKANIQLSMEGGMTISQSISQSLSYSDYGWDSSSSSSGLQIGALPFTQDCLLAKASAVLTVSVKPRLSLVLFSGLTEFYAEIDDLETEVMEQANHVRINNKATLHVVQLNPGGLGDASKRNAIDHWGPRDDIDVLTFEETKVNANCVKQSDNYIWFHSTSVKNENRDKLRKLNKLRARISQ